MKPNVIHYTIQPGQSLHSTYLATIVGPEKDAGLEEHPGSFSAIGQKLDVTLFHGRTDPRQNMDEWGFTGPTFECLSVAHDPDVILLQGACPVSLTLAERMGLAVHEDTITVPYTDDMVTVPRYRDDKPAYFGDFTIACN